MTMQKRLLTLFLLLSISFNILHAYVIEAYDTHPCQVTGYIDEFHTPENVPTDDICHLHHFFHIAFILPEVILHVPKQHISKQYLLENKHFKNDSHQEFLKPPISI